MNNLSFSTEYIAALAIVIVGILKLFKVDIGTSEITSIITAILGAWVMIRRFKRGDINVAGVKGVR
jgi:hypothetical protein